MAVQVDGRTFPTAAEALAYVRSLRAPEPGVSSEPVSEGPRECFRTRPTENYPPLATPPPTSDRPAGGSAVAAPAPASPPRAVSGPARADFTCPAGSHYCPSCLRTEPCRCGGSASATMRCPDHGEVWPAHMPVGWRIR